MESTLTRRAYSGSNDLERMMALVAAIHRRARHTHLHTGDVPHRIFNGMRRSEPTECVTLWEDAAGELVGWALIAAPYAAFELVIHPERRMPALETALAAWADAETRRRMADENPEETWVHADVFEGDTARAQILEALGYAAWETAYVLNVRSLNAPIAPPALPDGFTVRSAAGPQEAAELAAVHAGSFGSKWTAESYQALMSTPGYAAERELVVVAPDGRFAAFCIIWLDAVNGIGLFEPVGTHEAFRRMGLGRALMLEGLRRMQAHGMTQACVSYGTDNTPARGLYEGLGFCPERRIITYRKAVQAGSEPA